jgi:hypothetical protein
MNNILPPQEKRNIKKMIRLRFLIVICALVCTILCMVLLLIAPTHVMLRTQLGSITAQVATTRATSQYVQVDQALSDIGIRLEGFEKMLILPEDTPIYSTAKIIFTNPQEGITVQSFVIIANTNSLNIVGVARDRVALEAMVSYLYGLPGVTSVESPLSNFIKSKQAPFSLTVLF